MARVRQTPPPEPQPQPESVAPEVATLLGLAGVGAAGAAPAAAGAATVAITATAVRRATANILRALSAFARRREQVLMEELPARLRFDFPDRTEDEIAKLVREEARRETVFRRKMRDRLNRDLPDALREADAAKRAERVNAILQRERRYITQREKAMAERAYTRAEMLDLERLSPQGAFWKLSEGVQQHTVGCLAMGNKFWPWSVLRRFHPQLHPGCACHLYTLDEAVARGWMFPDQVPDPADAERRAASIIERVRDVYESVQPADIDQYVAELLEAKRKRNPEYERETEAIKRSAATPEAKKRHAFRAAKWTYPNGHPRCRLCGQEEAIGGVCNGKPTKAEAEAWAKRENESGFWGSTWVRKGGELVLQMADGGLVEAPIIRRGERYGMRPGERFRRGTTKGGQFRPRRGAAPGRPTVRGIAGRVLRRAIPDLPSTPAQERAAREGEWLWIRGRYTFVPKHREFRRKLDGIEFHSPAGSGNLYRNGYLIHVPGEKPPHHNDLDRPGKTDPRNIPSTAKWTPGVVTAERKGEIDDAIREQMNEEYERLHERVQAALNEQRSVVLPVTKGDPTALLISALEDNGFEITGVSSVERPDTESGVAALAILRHRSRAEVALFSDQGRVIDYFWTPTTQAEEPPEMRDSPPESWGDFVSDMTALAHEIGARYDRRVDLSAITVNEEIEDHAASYWAGIGVAREGAVVELGKEIRPSIERYIEARKAGEPLDAYEAGRLYAAVEATVHEMLHAGAGITPADYRLEDRKAMEEALNEEWAHLETSRVLRRLGMTEALQFQADMPDMPAARGSYAKYRTALDILLSNAKVAPEERQDFIEELRFRTPAAYRAQILAERIVSVAGPDHFPQWQAGEGPLEVREEEARKYVENVMGRADEGRGTVMVGFDPLLRLETEGFAPRQARVNGAVVQEGTLVDMRTPDGKLVTGEVKRVRAHPLGGHVFVVEDVDSDDRYTFVLSRQIEHVYEEANPDAVTLPDGSQVREGDLIRYDNRADGGMSEAVVERIVSVDEDRKRWVLHARTTENSLKPGQGVVLTPYRTSGDTYTGPRIEKVEASAERTGEGEAPPVRTEGISDEEHRRRVQASLTPLQRAEVPKLVAKGATEEQAEMLALKGRKSFTKLDDGTITYASQGRSYRIAPNGRTSFTTGVFTEGVREHLIRPEAAETWARSGKFGAVMWHNTSPEGRVKLQRDPVRPEIGVMLAFWTTNLDEPTGLRQEAQVRAAIRLDNPLEVTVDGETVFTAQAAARAIGFTGPDLGPVLARELRRQGYDGVVVRFPDSDEFHVATLDPKAVRIVADDAVRTEGIERAGAAIRLLDLPPLEREITPERMREVLRARGLPEDMTIRDPALRHLLADDRFEIEVFPDRDEYGQPSWQLVYGKPRDPRWQQVRFARHERDAERGGADAATAGIWIDPELAEVVQPSDPTALYGPEAGHVRRREGAAFLDEIEPEVEGQTEFLYRGMSAEEMANVLRTGKIETHGDYNLGDEQAGLTYFTTNSVSAASYAHGFAPYTMKATPERPAYVVKIRRPEAERTGGLLDHEVGVRGAVDASEIVEVFEGRVYEVQPTRVRLVASGYDPASGYGAGGSGGGIGATVAWRRIDLPTFPVRTEGIALDPRTALRTEIDRAELAEIASGTHRRVHIGNTRDLDTARERGWSDHEVLQVSREFADALDDYDEVLQLPAYQRVLRWSGDEHLADAARAGVLRYGTKRVGLQLLGDDNEKRDGWGVTNTGADSARVDTRRPGVRMGDTGEGGTAHYADARYTAIHEAHHMHGSNTEFDVGSEVAYAYHVDKRGLRGAGPDAARASVVSMVAFRGNGPDSRLGRSIRAIFGDDKLDEWARAAGWGDLFNRRPGPEPPRGIEGRVSEVNALATVDEKLAYLDGQNMADVTDLAGYRDRVAPGERVWMRPNGETLVLAPDGQARVLESMDDRAEAVMQESIARDPLEDVAHAAGFTSIHEAREEIELLEAWPQYREMEDRDLLAVSDRLYRRLHDAGERVAGGLVDRDRRGELTDAEREDLERLRQRRAAVAKHIAYRKRSARVAREREAQREAAEKGVLTISEAEFAEMLAKQGDVYADANYQGDYNPDLFRTSDLTGRLIRHYVTLPDGRVVHPNELHESRRRGRLVVVHNVAAPRERPRYLSDTLDESAREALRGDGDVVARTVGYEPSPEMRASMEESRRRTDDLMRFIAERVGGEVVPSRLGTQFPITKIRKGDATLTFPLNVYGDRITGRTITYAEPTGTGLGTAAAEALKEYADLHGLTVELYNISNPRFWGRFEWLEQFGTYAATDYFPERPANNLRYTPPTIEPMRVEGVRDPADRAPEEIGAGSTIYDEATRYVLPSGGVYRPEGGSPVDGAMIPAGRLVRVRRPGREGSVLIRLDEDATATETHVRLRGMRLRQTDHLGLGRTSEYVPRDHVEVLDEDVPVRTEGIETGDEERVERPHPLLTVRKRVEPRFEEAWRLRHDARDAEIRRNNYRIDLEPRPGETTFATDDPEYRKLDAEAQAASLAAAAAEERAGGRTYRLNEEQRAKLDGKLRELAKAAKKVGVAEPRATDVGEEWFEHRESDAVPEGRGELSRYVYTQVTGEEPKIAGWEFLASLQNLEGVNVIRRVPGSDESISLDHHRDGDPVCDYCKTKRDRKNTYVLWNPEEGTKQVGSSCIRDFLGHGDPNAMAAYMERWIALDAEFGEDDEGVRGGGGGRRYMPLDGYLTHVATMIRENGWTPRSAHSGQATADLAYTNFVNEQRQEKDRQGLPLWTDPTPQDEERARAALEWLRTEVAAKPDKSEFEHNMVALAKGDVVPDKGEGILAYSLVAHAKHLEREIERRRVEEKGANSQHVGEVGERLKGLRLTVENVFERESDYGVTYITKLSDADGNVFKWFGSYPLEQGKVYEGTFTVKKHDEFRGVKETVLTRPSDLREYDPDAPPPAEKPKKAGERVIARVTISGEPVDVEIEKLKFGFGIVEDGEVVEQVTTWKRAQDEGGYRAWRRKQRLDRQATLAVGLPEGLTVRSGAYNPATYMTPPSPGLYVETGDMVAFVPYDEKKYDHVTIYGLGRYSSVPTMVPAKPPEDNERGDLEFFPATVKVDEASGYRSVAVAGPDGIEITIGEAREVIVRGSAPALPEPLPVDVPARTEGIRREPLRTMTDARARELDDDDLLERERAAFDRIMEFQSSRSKGYQRARAISTQAREELDRRGISWARPSRVEPVRTEGVGRYFHGTTAELKPGDVIEPRPSERMTASPHYLDDVVYLSAEDHLAERFAVGRAGRRGGTPRVYEVEPLDDVRPDPEFEASGFGSDQVIVGRARVVREVPLPGLVRWDAESGTMMRAAGPIRTEGIARSEPDVATPARLTRGDFPEIEAVPGPDTGIRGHVPGAPAVSETLEHQRFDRGTGHFGTGVYFASTPERLGRGIFMGEDRPGGARGVVGVDLRGKRLWTPRDERQAWALYDVLSEVNYHATTEDDLTLREIKTFHDPELQRQFGGPRRGMSIVEKLASRAFRAGIAFRDTEIARAVESAREDVRTGRWDADSASTRLMKARGYDGVDVRHLDEQVDNTRYGSVLYRDDMFPAPLDVEEAVAQEAVEPRGRLSFETLDGLVRAERPSRRGPVFVGDERLPHVTYTPKLKRPATARDFATKGELWVGDQFFDADPNVRRNLIVRELGNEIARVSENEPWFPGATDTLLIYGEASADDPDMEFLDSDAGRGVARKALEAGFPINPEVEKWARGAAAPEPTPVPETEPEPGGDDFDELLETLRSKARNPNFVRQLLLDEFSFGRGDKLGFALVGEERDGEIVRETFKNHDNGRVVEMVSRETRSPIAPLRVESVEMVEIKGYRTNLDLPRSAPTGTPEHAAITVRGMALEEAQAWFREHGFHPVEEWRRGGEGGWLRFTDADGVSIVGKPGRRPARKITVAHLDTTTERQRKEAREAVLAADQFGGLRAGQRAEDAFDEMPDEWSSTDFQVISEAVRVSDFRHPEHGPIRAVVEGVSPHGTIAAVGRPDPNDPRGVLSEEDFEMAESSRLSALDPAQAFAESLIGTSEADLYKRPEFQEKHDGQGYFYGVQRGQAGSVGVYRNHDEGKTLVLHFDSRGLVERAEGYQRSYPTVKGETSGGPELPVTSAVRIADEWRAVLGDLDTTADQVRPYMTEYGYVDTGIEGGWHRFTHGETGESVMFKFGGGSSHAWNEQPTQAVYADDTPDAVRWRARGKWLIADPLERIKVGDVVSEVHGPLMAIRQSGLGGIISPEGGTFQWLQPWSGSARRMRVRYDADGRVTEVGFAQPERVEGEDRNVILTLEEFEREKDAQRAAFRAKEDQREELERADFERRKALIEEREAPVEVGEPGSEVITRLREQHGFTMQSRKRVRFTKAEWAEKVKEDPTLARRSSPAFRGYSYVLRDGNGHTLKLRVDGNVPVGSTFLGMPVSSGSVISKVEWTPAKQTGRDRLEGPPDTVEALIAGSLGRADELGERYGVQVRLPTVIPRSGKPDHSGHHEWNGTIVLGKDVRPDIEAAAKKIKAGQPLTDHEAGQAFSAWQTLQHEIGHAVNPLLSPAEYGKMNPLVAMEEALTEETSHALTIEWLRATGQTEIVEWAKANLGDERVVGTYRHHRTNFRRALDAAEVPEEERREVMFRMKFSMGQQERFDYLGGRIAEAQGMSHEDGVRRLRGILQPSLSHRKFSDEHRHVSKGGKFEAIIDTSTDLEGVEARATSMQIANGTVEVGSRVVIPEPPADWTHVNAAGERVSFVENYTSSVEALDPKNGRVMVYTGEEGGRWIDANLVRLQPVPVGEENRHRERKRADLGDLVVNTRTGKRGEVVAIDTVGDPWSGNNSILRVRWEDDEQDLTFLVPAKDVIRADQPILADDRGATGRAIIVEGEPVLPGDRLIGRPTPTGQWKGDRDRDYEFAALYGFQTSSGTGESWGVGGVVQLVTGRVFLDDGSSIELNFPLTGVRRAQPVEELEAALEMLEAEWDEALHPRDRIGRWIEKLGDFPRLIYEGIGVDVENVDVAKLTRHIDLESQPRSRFGTSPCALSIQLDFAVHRVLPAMLRRDYPDLARRLEETSPRWGRRAAVAAVPAAG